MNYDRAAVFAVLDYTDPVKLYDELASWWPLMSPPEQYEEEAGLYAEFLASATDGRLQTVVELGSGGGNNASFLKRRFDMTLVEPSEGMLEVSRELNPECTHVRGDMRTVRLDRTFDAVFVHDAVTYMASPDDLRSALATAAAHCRPGGGLVVAPDFIKENFKAGEESGGTDRGGRGLRYLEWTFDPDPTDQTYVVDYVYMLRVGPGEVEVVHDRHVEGLFSRADWLRWLDEAGFDARVVVVPHAELEYGAYEAFVGTRRPDL